MKRRDLSVGLAVEIQEGREYRAYSDAIVLDTEPWMDDRSKFSRYGPRYRRAKYDHAPKTGVAVALKAWDGWAPLVVPLSKIVPVGSRAAYEEQRRRQQQEHEASEARRRTRQEEIAEALGVKSYQVSVDRLGIEVKIPIAALEALIAKANAGDKIASR